MGRGDLYARFLGEYLMESLLEPDGIGTDFDIDGGQDVVAFPQGHVCQARGLAGQIHLPG